MTLILPWTSVRDLTIKALADEEINQAFPLVQAAVPRVTLDQWRDFARRKTAATQGGATGIQGVLTEQNYIAGLGIYRVEYDLCHGSTLIVDYFLALDLFNREAVIHALAESLEDIAHQRGCLAIHTHIAERVDQWQGPPNGMSSILRQRGHVIKSLRMCKLLDQAPQRERSGYV